MVDSSVWERRNHRTEITEENWGKFSAYQMLPLNPKTSVHARAKLRSGDNRTG
jgi:hypothetical protein